MRKIVLMMSVSLDGYMEGPGRDISWHRVDDEIHQDANDAVAGMAGLLSGRVTYDLMADFWPTADADPETPAVMAEFAGIWREIPKYVYSRTLRHADWNTTIVREVVPAEVRALKEQHHAGLGPGDLGLGGADLADVFLRHGLVDRIRLYVHPVLIGRGKPLFRHADTMTGLHLVESRAFGNGVVLLRYDVEHD
ncbi:dihydrofolate reductase family protein [Streptomyces sp. NBC_00582]|uniref:dihydrofolate reductase family protein n=1 Tax=Streptomyces sp. NBC_00582 TaxID=2975783 RepID=UPI002E80D742|nr:dihydrofolate reductase family protein [Streptomyces sp. NBC_00582]WUB62202.1 dihydrofolate reductase family protein [Streptomyces sp. NBC_00582]